MATERDLLNRVLHLLRSPAARKVDFTLDGFYLDSGALGVVATAVELKATGHKGIGLRLGRALPTDAEASYDPADNVFDFPNADYGSTAFQRMSIAHEAVHAFLDLIKSNTKALTDEALAYVGGQLFHLHATPGRDAPPWANDLNPVFAEAYRIAVPLLKAKTPIVAEADAASLRAVIASRPAYARLLAHPNMTYANNGVFD